MYLGVSKNRPHKLKNLQIRSPRVIRSSFPEGGLRKGRGVWSLDSPISLSSFAPFAPRDGGGGLRGTASAAKPSGKGVVVFSEMFE